MLDFSYRELNYKTNLKYTLGFSQTDAQIEPKKAQMVKAIWVFFRIPLLDVETTTTGYPGARRATRLLTAISSSAASGRESEKKLSQTLALQNLRKQMM